MITTNAIFTPVIATDKMSEIKKQIGRLIQENRKAKGLSQAELAALIGSNQVVVSRYEMGTQNLTIDTIQKIATALKTDISITFKA